MVSAGIKSSGIAIIPDGIINLMVLLLLLPMIMIMQLVFFNAKEQVTSARRIIN